MKRYLAAMLVAAASTRALAADVGVSVSVGQPGFYGRIEPVRAPLSECHPGSSHGKGQGKGKNK